MLHHEYTGFCYNYEAEKKKTFPFGTTLVLFVQNVKVCLARENTRERHFGR